MQGGASGSALGNRVSIAYLFVRGGQQPATEKGFHLTTVDITPAAYGFRGFFSRITATLISAATAYGAAQSRADEVERLNAKSDAELSRIGLRREDIARYVFRDILYI